MLKAIKILKKYHDQTLDRHVQIGEILFVPQDISLEQADKVLAHPSRVAERIESAEETEEAEIVSNEPQEAEGNAELLKPPLKSPEAFEEPKPAAEKKKVDLKVKDKE